MDGVSIENNRISPPSENDASNCHNSFGGASITVAVGLMEETPAANGCLLFLMLACVTIRIDRTWEEGGLWGSLAVFQICIAQLGVRVGGG